MFKLFVCFAIILFPFQQNIDKSKLYYKESNFKSNKNNQTLFVIERNINTNTIYYDANLLASGKLNPNNPIDEYYIHYATDNKRAELSMIERKMVYGYSFEKNENNNYFVKLKAYKERFILLHQDINNKVYAMMKINGKEAYLKKIYVFAKPNLYTSVIYIELNGEDVKTKAPVYEKILNN